MTSQQSPSAARPGTSDDTGIIDAHAHYISPRIYHHRFFREQYRFHKTLRETGKPFDRYLDTWFENTLSPKSPRDAGLVRLLDDMKTAGVETAVIASTSPREDDDIFRITQQYSNLFGLFWMDPSDPQGACDRFLHARSVNPKILGMKATIQYRRIAPDNPRFNPLYDTLNRLRLPVQFHMGDYDKYSRPETYRHILEHYPDMIVILLHGGGARWLEIPELVNTYPNLYVELEALQLTELDAGIPTVLRHLLDTCGPDKIMFGSDWIWSDTKYFQRVELIRRLPLNVRKAVGGGTARCAFNMPMSGSGGQKICH